MSDLFSQRTVYRCLLIFCIFHVLVWTISCAAWYPHPPQDALEGVMWGQMWLWGYNKHPFLAPWLTAGISELFGVVGWPIYLLGQLAVALCFWLVFELGRRMMPAWRALLGVIMLEMVVYYNYQASNFNPNVAMLPLWAWMILSFYLALTLNRWRDWLLLGLATGLAVDAKYQSGLLVMVFVLFALLTPSLWRVLANKKTYVAGLIALLVFLPNFIWLASHQFMAVTYAMGELGETTDPVSFLLNQCVTLLPMLLLYVPFLRGRASFDVARFDRYFLWWMSLGALVLTLAMAVFGHAHLQKTWAYPYFSTLGLLWVASLKPVVTLRRLKILAVLLCVWAVLGFSAIGLYYHVIVPAKKINNPPRNTLPGERIARAVSGLWFGQFHVPMKYVAGSYGVLVDLSAYIPSKPKAYFGLSTDSSPWVRDADFRQQGGAVVVWLNYSPGSKQAEIDSIKKRYPRICGAQEMIFPRDLAKKAPPVKLWVAFLPPKGQRCTLME
ncbi:MAG: hypothetical protein COV52_00510 [Gammaproteobacteria bacterium CG11_big_fil_rev_8_21_14_0_20_46_22]|nr:MAG: hypothetical protein COW05_09005 [Gammaproteobacteria bacterium CG12_big_fil_rev_8_21_14_0_65_46_12]PIR12137.1 MAG: hypothetical protein COV52_00510 [Gammaproteobacteria bacterium CG11_big_fil_rev_8_21_14_0_20_46_22]